MEDYGSAKGYLELDISNLESNVKSAIKYLDDLDRKSALADSELNKLESQSVRTGNVFQQASRKTRELASRMDGAKQKCKLYDAEIGNLNTIIKNAQAKQKSLAAEIEKASGKYARAEEKVKKVAEAHGKESEEYKKAVTSAKNAQNTLTQLQNQYDALGIEIEDSGNKVTEFKTKLNDTQADVNRMTVELERAQNRAVLYGESMQEIGGKLETAGAKLSGWGNTLSMAVTAPVGAAGTAAVKLAADAETSFAKVSTIADETVLTYDKMKTGVTEASTETGVAITDFNEALYSSLSAGVESGKAIEFTTEMVKLARGGFTDTAKAVDVVTSVLNAYGLSADQASSISDKLVMTQNIGKTTVDELAGSLGRIIPTAKAFNVDMDNVSTGMAILTKRGIQTAEATTYYNSMLNELGASGTVADKALRELSGKGFTQMIAEGTPLTEILQMLSDKAGENGQSLSDMFGSMEAGKAALSLMSDGGAEYNQVLEQMKNSTGVAQDAFDKMSETSAVQMQIELNKLKNAGVEVGTQLLPYVTKLVEGVGDLADRFSELSPEQQKTIIKMAALAAGMGPVLKITGSVTSGVGSLSTGIGKLLKAAGNAQALKVAEAGITGVGEAATVAGSGTGILSTAIGALTSPVGIAVGSVALLTAGAVALNAAFGEDLEATRLLTESQRENLAAMQDSIATLNEQREAREEAVGGISVEYDGYRSLVSELESITDANGRVKAGYEERAGVITGLLSSALGTEISLQDGVIENYDETIAKSKELIAQKEAEALISSMQNDMANAYEKTEKAISEYRDAQKAVEEQQKKVTAAEEAYRKGGPKQKQIYDEAKADLEELEDSMGKAKTAMEDLSTEVNNYNALMEAAASGDTAKIEAAITHLVTSYKSFTAEALQESETVRQSMYDQANGYVENMQLVQNGTVSVADDVYQKMATSASNSIKEFSKLPGGIAEGIKAIGPEASGAIIASLAQANIDGVLTEEARQNVESYLGGFEGLDQKTQEAWAQAWYGALKGLDGFEELSDPAEEGVDAFLESLKSALEVHSPSEAVRRIFAQVWPGASAGLDEGSSELSGKGTETVGGFLSSVLSAITSGQPGITQAFNLLGGSGYTSMQTGLTSKGKLTPPGVLGITGITKPIGVLGNIAMGSGLISKILKAPGLNGISGEASRIGRVGNTYMGSGLRASNLTPPRINDLDAGSKAQKARSEMQSYFSRNPLSVVVNVAQKVGGVLSKLFADGGIATEPSIFGEDGPEMAIPLSPGKKDRAKALYAQTGRLLGLTKEETQLRSAALNNTMLTGSQGRKSEESFTINVPDVDYDLLADKISAKLADVLRKNPIQPVIQMRDGDVYLDNERVGRKQAPVVSRILSI